MFVDLVPSRVTSAVTFDSTSEPLNFPVGLSIHPAPTAMSITCDGKKHSDISSYARLGIILAPSASYTKLTKTVMHMPNSCI